MFKKLLLFIAILTVQYSIGQVTFKVEVPKGTSSQTSIYISGDFENWSGGQKAYQLSKKGNNYFITFPNQKGEINFKFTQGNWSTVEVGKNESQIENRNYNFINKVDTVFVKIAKWYNKETKKSTAAKNVFVLTDDFDIPQLSRERRIWIYLPPNYKKSTKLYPVIYMHDGQNLFDDKTSYAGEWEVDEILNDLFKEKGLEIIVVGIDNGGEKRMSEYSPWENSRYGKADGEAYVEFIVNTLKPLIDKTFRAKSDRKNTAIMGSSMGGLISHYAGLKYPSVFGKVGVFSPSFWYAKPSFQFTAKNSNLEDTKMYYLVGGKEGDTMVPDMKKMIALMKTKGFKATNIFEKVVSDGKHTEAFWRKEFKQAILWMFAK